MSEPKYTSVNNHHRGQMRLALENFAGDPGGHNSTRFSYKGYNSLAKHWLALPWILFGRSVSTAVQRWPLTNLIDLPVLFPTILFSITHRLSHADKDHGIPLTRSLPPEVIALSSAIAISIVMNQAIDKHGHQLYKLIPAATAIAISFAFNVVTKLLPVPIKYNFYMSTALHLALNAFFHSTYKKRYSKLHPLDVNGSDCSKALKWTNYLLMPLAVGLILNACFTACYPLIYTAFHALKHHPKLNAKLYHFMAHLSTSLLAIGLALPIISLFENEMVLWIRGMLAESGGVAVSSDLTKANTMALTIKKTNDLVAGSRMDFAEILPPRNSRHMTYQGHGHPDIDYTSTPFHRDNWLLKYGLTTLLLAGSIYYGFATYPVIKALTVQTYMHQFASGLFAAANDNAYFGVPWNIFSTMTTLMPMAYIGIRNFAYEIYNQYSGIRATHCCDGEQAWFALNLILALAAVPFSAYMVFNAPWTMAGILSHQLDAPNWVQGVIGSETLSKFLLSAFTGSVMLGVSNKFFMHCLPRVIAVAKAAWHYKGETSQPASYAMMFRLAQEGPHTSNDADQRLNELNGTASTRVSSLIQNRVVPGEP